VRYWAKHPPVHISVAALLRGFSGKAGKGGQPDTGPADVAEALGPPQQAFRAPVRMQTSAPPADQPE
jgi:hypothetical protein